MRWGAKWVSEVKRAVEHVGMEWWMFTFSTVILSIWYGMAMNGITEIRNRKISTTSFYFFFFTDSLTESSKIITENLYSGNGKINICTVDCERCKVFDKHNIQYSIWINNTKCFYWLQKWWKKHKISCFMYLFKLDILEIQLVLFRLIWKLIISTFCRADYFDQLHLWINEWKL